MFKALLPHFSQSCVAVQFSLFRPISITDDKSHTVVKPHPCVRSNTQTPGNDLFICLIYLKYYLYLLPKAIYCLKCGFVCVCSCEVELISRHIYTHTYIHNGLGTISYTRNKIFLKICNYNLSRELLHCIRFLICASFNLSFRNCSLEDDSVPLGRHGENLFSGFSVLEFLLQASDRSCDLTVSQWSYFLSVCMTSQHSDISNLLRSSRTGSPMGSFLICLMSTVL